MSVKIEASGLEAIARDLDVAADKTHENVRKAVEVTARHVKDDARSAAKRIGRHAKYYPYSISYDITDGGTGVSAEIGPDKHGPQGALGNLLEFGSIHNAPRPHLGPALQKNVSDFEHGLLKATEEALPS